MNIFYFNKLIYKGNINRDFYLYCCHKKKTFYLYILIHWLYFILGFFSNKFSLLYIKNYHQYLNKIENINIIIDEFYNKKKNKINLWYKNKYSKNNIIIAKCPKILVQKFLNEEQIIAYNLTKNNKIDMKNYLKENLSLNKEYKETYYNSFQEVGTFESNLSYVYKYGNFFIYNKNLYKVLSIFFKVILVLVLSLLLLLISFTFTTVYIDKTMINSYFNDHNLIWLNLFPIIFLIVLIIFLTKRLWISFGITSIVIFLIGIINKTKLYYRDDVLKFEDLNLFKEALIMTKRYQTIIRWYTMLSIIICLIITFLIKKRIKKINIKYRYCIIISILLIIIGIYQYKNTLTNPELYNSIGDKTLINNFISTRQSQIRGLIYPFIYSSTEITYKAPADYNKKEIKEILSNYNYDNISEDKKVNIIGIMLEAYNDFSKFDNIEINKDVYEPFHNIQKQSLSGTIIVDIFGGGTISTERHFITGFNTFPNFRNATNSYASYFKEQGYITEAMHPIYGAFYNRNTVNLNMGFDNYWNYENKFSKVREQFLTDDKFFKYIIEGLENANKDKKPYFNFSVTYQNHGPYSTDETSYKHVKDKGYSTNALNMFNRYLEGIKATNNSLNMLVEYLKNYEEPTILIVFGDHNPYLGEANYVYNELGIDMSLKDINSYENYYSIPYFIYGNNAAKEKIGKSFVGKANTISPNFLMNELFEYIGFKGNEYLKYTSEIKRHIDVFSNDYYKEDGKYILKNETKYQNIINEFQKVNYYYATNYRKK